MQIDKKDNFMETITIDEKNLVEFSGVRKREFKSLTQLLRNADNLSIPYSKKELENLNTTHAAKDNL